MAMAPSGTGPRNPSAGGATISQPPPPKPMPQRKSAPQGSSVATLNSTPESRSAATSRSSVEVQDVQLSGTDDVSDSPTTEVAPSPGSQAVSQGVSVGQPTTESGQQERVSKLTAESNSAPAGGGSALSASEKAANANAVTARKAGVLGCATKAVAPTGPSSECGDCGPAECLTDLMKQMLPKLPTSAKGLLCNIASSAEKAAKKQLDAVGNSLLNAATDLASADVLKAPLSEIDKELGKLDAGAIAKCFGAQQLIDSARGQLKRVNNVIADAESGVQDKLASKFNKALEGAKQWSVAGKVC